MVSRARLGLGFRGAGLTLPARSSRPSEGLSGSLRQSPLVGCERRRKGRTELKTARFQARPSSTSDQLGVLKAP